MSQETCPPPLPPLTPAVTWVSSVHQGQACSAHRSLAGSWAPLPSSWPAASRTCTGGGSYMETSSLATLSSRPHPALASLHSSRCVRACPAHRSLTDQVCCMALKCSSYCSAGYGRYDILQYSMHSIGLHSSLINAVQRRAVAEHPFCCIAFLLSCRFATSAPATPSIPTQAVQMSTPIALARWA